MKITKIAQQEKLKSRYSIFVDEKYAFSLSESAVLEQQIHVGLEITKEQLHAFKEASQLDKAYNLTLAYVARRPRSEWELRDYFKRKSYEPEVGDQILERLQNFGYVNDESFARSWVENRRILKPVSKRRLTQELKQKRVSDEVVRKILDEDEISDRDTLRQLVERKRKQTKYQDNTKLMQYLARQGYGYDDIKSVLNAEDTDY